MPAIDVPRIQELISIRDVKRRECVGWCEQALREYPQAIATLNTPSKGNPKFFDAVFGRDAKSGIFPILRVTSDNILIELGHGAALTGSGTLWTGGSKSSLEDAAVWIAARCGFSLQIAQEVIKDALMGEPWAVSDALKAANRSK